jgi:Flp pilus assembly protein TadB
MTIAGSLLAGCAVLAAILALRRPSDVLGRLAMLAPRPSRSSSVFVSPRDLELSGAGWSGAQLLAIKIVVAGAAAAVALAFALLVPIGPAVVIAAAYGGFVLPSVRIERRAAGRRSDAERALVTLVEWVEALVTAGRPVETAIVAVAARGVGSSLMDATLAAVSRAYALGAPLFAALAREARRAGLDELARLAADLERARDLGQGAATVLADEVERSRATERARALDAAGQVEGRLMLVLVLCYLPALMLLVVIPLFLGLLNGLFT